MHLKDLKARRGVPKKLISDQGSNFKGFNRELKSIADNSITLNYLSDTGIEWKVTGHWSSGQRSSEPSGTMVQLK